MRVAMTKTARIYKIEMLIRNRGHISFQDLLDELEVSPATLKRDLEYLRDRLGAPIDYDRFVNGYRLREEFRGGKHELPGLWFSERELYALLMAHQLLSDVDAEGVISRHLQPLLERIHQMLGTAGVSAAAGRQLLSRVKIASPVRRPVSTQYFEIVAEALLERRRLSMRYLTRARGQSSRREVSPQRLVHYRNTWYLDAWCHTRERLLRFALDAIEDAAVTPDKALDMPLKRVQDEMDSGYGVFAGSHAHWATLVFSAQAARWVGGEQWHPLQRSRWLDDGRYQLELPYADPTELAMDVMRHADEVDIVADTGRLAATVRERTQRAWKQLAKTGKR